MRTLGLIFPAPALATVLIVGGLSLAERQARALRRAGCATVLFAGGQSPAGAEAISMSQLAGRIEPGDQILILAPGLALDERALAALASCPAPAMLVADATRPGAMGVERLDALTFAAGACLLPGRLVAETASSIGDWDLASTLTRAAAADPSTRRIDLHDLPVYDPGRRRDVPLLWAMPASPEEAARASADVIAAAQKGCLDWPARFLHPPIENLLTQMLAPTRITPNMVTLATGVLGLAALIAFATGWLWTGLLLALLCGPLDGVDGKLARTRIEYSRYGDLEHLLDKVLEYGWYLAAAAHFAAVRQSGLPWAVAALIILPAAVEAIQGEFFRRFTGFQLDDAGLPERRIRLFAGRRNTFLWTWLAFAALGAWFEGFVVLAGYSVVTTGLALWRFNKRMGEYGRAHSEAVAANFGATRYTFLSPKG
jgi:phosphatidylglycerophosphate synthase